MKICITSQGNNLDSQIDTRFGRCNYFIILDTDTNEFKALENPSLQAMGGAGVQAGQFVIEQDVNTVITGNVGPNAFQTLKAGNINVLTNASGTIKEVVEKYKKGDLQSTDNPSVERKFGMS